MFTPRQKKRGKKRWNGFLKHLPCAASTDQHTHTHTHTWRKALIEILTRRTPHTLTKTPLLSHTSTPLKTVQNWAHRWRILISFVLIRCECVCFFLRAKDFACGYNMDMSHAHRSHRPIAVIVGQSYCHISGLITTAICGRQAGRLRRTEKFFANFPLFINGKNAKK